MTEKTKIRISIVILICALGWLLTSCKSVQGNVQFKEGGIYVNPEVMKVVDHKRNTIVDLYPENREEFMAYYDKYKNCIWKAQKKGNKITYYITCN